MRQSATRRARDKDDERREFDVWGDFAGVHLHRDHGVVSH